MTTIEVACPRCGTVECLPKDFELRVARLRPETYYFFQCPQCGDHVRRKADRRAIKILKSHGVKATLWNVPDEVCEEKTGPAFTHDDLIDFHLKLSDPDWFADIRSIERA